MSRALQDQFVDDDEEEVCPLCVEEFDLSDKNFRPCPCGYQICQFCYNNIKTTMNGLCPACRRPYDEKSIEFKNVTAEELAMHKAEIAQKAKKNAALRQKEKQKVEADNLSRKHLAGLRVVQKNLVYVTGLTPTIQDDRLHEMLRGTEYFGQYGKIIKIVVSKAKDPAHSNSVGIYVTFARKEDATACIQAVDGSQNGSRTLRAQYGTTKYCSAYLRNETCNNRNCMFLHEAGEENDSFTRQDLSSMNVISTQQPAQSLSPHTDANPLQPQPPPQRAPHNIAAAAPPMNRQESNDAPASPTNSGDGPALPSTANWGSKPLQGRRASRSTNASTSSPMPANAVPATPLPMKTEQESSRKKGKDSVQGGSQRSSQPSKSSTPQPTSLPARERRALPDLEHVLKAITSTDFKFVFSAASLTQEEYEVVTNFPQLLDPNGGAKRRAMKDKQEQAAAETTSSIPPNTNVELEDNPEGGSLQLGGEPEERHDVAPGRGQQHVIAPPSQNSGLGFGQGLSDDFSGLGLNGRGLTAQQQQQLHLLKSTAPQSANLLGTFMSQQQPQQQPGSAPGHARHTSRFSFANDSASASAAVQPVANAKLMNQQSSMMPKNTNQFNQLGQHQGLINQFYTSGVQGPPPGLKATGTPPVSGGGMFGQGHGFATGGVGYGANAAGRSNDPYQDLLRERSAGGRVPDAGKHEPEFAPFEQASLSVDALVNDADSFMDSSIDIEDPIQSHGVVGSHVLEPPRRATPTIPPGFSAPSTPKFLSNIPIRPLSRTGATAITPAVPVIPATPLRPATPLLATPIRPATPLRAVTPILAKQDEKKDFGAHKQHSRNPIGTLDRERSSAAGPKAASATSKEIVPPAGKAVEKTSEDRMEPKSTGDSITTEPIISKSPSKQVGKGKRTASDAASSVAPSPLHHASLSQQKEAKSNTRAVSTPTKRQPPGKLDISAATKLSESDLADSETASTASKPDTQARNPRALSLASTGSHPTSPVVPSTGSPVKRNAPRTIRVLPTPKSEVPPPLSASSAASMPPLPNVGKLRSRQASVTSLYQPGTPASELVSETASITSTSLSRANSPPPGGKVGSAPLRKSKAQAKRERQERAKQIAEEKFTAVEDLVKSSDPEPVQAPIIGRKKKAKKPVTSSNAASSTPAMSQPASPKPTKQLKVEDEHEAAESPHSAAAPADAKRSPTINPFDALAASAESPNSSRNRGEPTATSILADLQRTGDLLTSTLEFFKPLSASLAHMPRNISPIASPIDPNAPPSPPDLKIHFSEADLDALAKKLPVHLGGEDGKTSSRTLITPQGKFLWGLSKDLEERVLELEKRVEDVKGIARWHDSSKAQRRASGPHGSRPSHKDLRNDVLPAIATALKEAGAKLGKQSQSATGAGTGNANATETPATAKPNLKPPTSFDDALGYLNQWVLPPDTPGHLPRGEQASVGGPAPTHSSHLAAAAKIVAAGGGDASKIPIPDLENLGVFAAEVLGGYVVQGLEALVGPGAMGVPSYGASAYGKVGSAFGGGAGGGGMGGAAAGMGSQGGPVLSVEEAEQAMLQSRREAEQLEKKVNALVKRNKRLLAGTAGGK